MKKTGISGKKMAMAFILTALTATAGMELAYAQTITTIGLAGDETGYGYPAVALKLDGSDFSGALIFSGKGDGLDYYYGFDQEGKSSQYNIEYLKAVVTANDTEYLSLYTCEDQTIFSDISVFEVFADPVKGQEYTVMDYDGNRSQLVITDGYYVEDEGGYYTGTCNGTIDSYPAAVYNESGSLIAIAYGDYTNGNIALFSMWYDEDTFLSGESSGTYTSPTTEASQATTTEATTVTTTEGTTTTTTAPNSSDSSIPKWIWYAVGAAVVIAFFMIKNMIDKKKKDNNQNNNIHSQHNDNNNYQVNNSNLPDEDDTVDTVLLDDERHSLPHTSDVSENKMYWLTGVGGMMSGQRYPVEYPVSIGRDTDCVIRYPAQDTKISRHHAVVIRKDDRIYVRDSSKAGSYLITRGSSKAQRLPLEQYVELHEGDCIYIACRENGFRLDRKEF